MGAQLPPPGGALAKEDCGAGRLPHPASIGADIGSNFKRQEIEVDAKALAAGIVDAIAGKTAMTDAEMKTVLNDFRKDMMAKVEAKQKVSGEKNVKEGEAVNETQTLVWLIPDRTTILDALRALAYVGTKEDLPVIEAVSRIDASSETISQVSQTAKAIRAR